MAKNAEFVAALQLLIGLQEEESLTSVGKDFLASLQENNQTLMKALDSMDSPEDNLIHEKWAVSLAKRFLKAYEKEHPNECKSVVASEGQNSHMAIVSDVGSFEEAINLVKQQTEFSAIPAECIFALKDNSGTVVLEEFISISKAEYEALLESKLRLDSLEK